MLSCGYLRFIYFWKTIYEVVSGWSWLLGGNHSLWSKTEVLCQVDNLHVLRNIVFLQERLALAVTEAEEDDIHLVERHLGGKLQISLAIQSLVQVLVWVYSYG